MRDRFDEAMTDATNVHGELLAEQKEACAALQQELDNANEEIAGLKDTCSDLRDTIHAYEEERG